MLRRIFAAVFQKSNAKRLVGVDHLGNKYYESERADGKRRRFLERADGVKPEDYVHGMIPNQWEAWIRGRVDTPPTVMELLEREKMEKIIAARAADLKRKDDEAQQKAYDEGLISRMKDVDGPHSTQTKQIGHASAPFYGTSEQQKDPGTVAGNFKPGAWKPQTKTRIDEGGNEAEEHFQPDSWTPKKQTKP